MTRAADPITLLFLAATLVTCLLLALIPATAPMGLQLGLLIAAVALLGLPHGALDGALLRNGGFWPRRYGHFWFHFFYLAMAGLVIVLWWWLPVLALAAFLLISALHFSGDFRPAPLIMRGLGGGLIILLPLAFHPEQAAVIFVVLSGEAARPLAEQLSVSPASIIVAMALCISLAPGRRLHTGLELLALLSLAWVAPPLIYFAIYFCFLHSARHFHRCWHHTPPGRRGALGREALIYSLASVVGAVAIAAWLIGYSSLDKVILQVTFIGLAALTAPHMLIVGLAGPDPARQARRLAEND